MGRGVYCEGCAMKLEQGESKHSFVAIPVERLLELSEKAGGLGEFEATTEALRGRGKASPPPGVKLG